MLGIDEALLGRKRNLANGACGDKVAIDIRRMHVINNVRYVIFIELHAFTARHI